MSEERWSKACDCEGATASGPRVVTTGTEAKVPDMITARFEFVRWACDVCDTPWVRES